MIGFINKKIQKIDVMNEARIIGIISGKGGVGKTTLTVNLGMALKNLGNDVTLIDADFSASNLGVYLGQYDHPVKIQKVLRGEARVDQAIFRHPTGVKAVTSSKSINQAEPSTAMLRDILETASKGEDFVLVDCPPGIGTTVEGIIEACDELIVVTMPTQTASVNAAQIMQECRMLEKPVLGTVLNKVEDNPEKELVNREVEMMTDSNLLATIPYDQKMKESLFENTALVTYDPLSPASIAIKQLAANLSGEEYERPKLLKAKRKMNRIKSILN